VTSELKDEAYNDNPLRFAKMGFNISAPHMYAMCLENLDIQPGNVILDIGSGSGHLTALAGYLTGPTGLVHGLDLYDHIIEFSKKNVAEFLASRPPDSPQIILNHVHFIKRNCFLPAPEVVLYDRIHVGCCCPESHIQSLYDILKPNGILVTPFGDKLIKAVKQADGVIRVNTLVSVRYSDLTLPSDAEVKEAHKQIEIAKATKIVIPQMAIAEQFKLLFESQNFHNFLFIVEGKQIFAHKLLLQIRSETFRECLGNANQLEVPNCTAVTFHEFLRYFYTDNCNITPANHAELTFLAKEFKFESLLAKLENRDCSSITLLHALDKLVSNSFFSDISFDVEGTVIPAHKLILQVRTEYFHRMFSSGLRESQQSIIRIYDCSPAVFIDVLKFIYTDSCSINEVNCNSLMEQANFFQLDRLKAICENFWIGNINVHNACSIIQIAEQFNATQLKDFAREFIFSHIQEVITTEGFKELDQVLVSQILLAAVQRSK
jgi:protein-L-isoaspartate O-methyltransferase